jgi:alpha-mannosidase
MTIRTPEEHLDVRVVVHTHWDREWYLPAARFRTRLVALMDDILDGAAGAPFLLDGQAVVLDDYLNVRPERAADVSRALRNGDIEAGPWYVLADELIPSGEGLVRNLLAGRRVLQSLRASPPPVLYCPDSFGHPAMLPALASGFGLPVVILWRGYGGASHPPGDTALWIAPDESRAIIYHLPPDGYEFASHLPVAQAAASDRWSAMRAIVGPRATTKLVLLTAGADHHAPQLNLADAISALTTAAAPDVVQRSSLGDFSRVLVERVTGTALPTVRGELRDSHGYAWTLQGTLAARAALKRRYAGVERLLIRDTEPWAAMAWRMHGTDRRHVLRAAWQPLLLCQPHDTLCGTSIDAVAAAMSARLDESEASAVEARDASILSLAGHDADAARLDPLGWRPVVLVRNRAARRRSGVAEVDVDLVLDDAPVGPASAGIEPRHRRTGPLTIGDPAVPLQELDRTRTFAREEAPHHYPWNRLVERRRVLVFLSDAPALGITPLPVIEGRRQRATPPEPVSVSGKVLHGRGHAVHVAEHDLRFIGENCAIDDWLQLEVEGERGDLYTRSAIPDNRSPGRMVRSRVVQRGPLRAAIEIDWQVSVPERRLTSATGEARRARALKQDVRTTVYVDAGAPYVRIDVSGTNLATDVRLRIGCRTGIATPRVIADAAFGPIERQELNIQSASGQERPVSTAPLHRFVSCYDDTRGITIYSDGLAEYEADTDGVVWITLLRAVGELSRHNLPERPGHAGYPAVTPDAQSLGPFSARFAFAAHGPYSDDVVAFVERVADDVLVPLTGDTWRTAPGRPVAVEGPTLAGDGLALSTVAQSEDGNWLLLRCVNHLTQPVDGTWTLPGLREAILARLDETPREALPVRDGTVAFTAGPRAVVTILAR